MGKPAPMRCKEDMVGGKELIRKGVVEKEGVNKFKGK
jgi:hypothetical protein